MTKRELSQIGSLKKEIQELEMLKADLLRTFGESGKQVWPARRQDGMKDCLEKHAEELRDLNNQIDKKKTELAQQYRRVLCWLDSIPDSQLRRIYLLRYMMGRSWQQISNEFDNSRSADALQQRAKRFLEKS